jgi:copper chaperone
MISQYTVTGMSCEHCVGRVSAELSRIEGVTSVEVDLPSGLVSVTSGSPLDHASVDAAIDEAGYELTSA